MESVDMQVRWYPATVQWSVIGDVRITARETAWVGCVYTRCARESVCGWAVCTLGVLERVCGWAVYTRCARETMCVGGLCVH